MTSGSRWLWLGAVLAALAFAPGGCVTDHSALAKRDTGGAAGAPDAGDAAGSAGVGGAGGSLPDASVDADAEPPGDNVVTLLHGVVDAETIAFCFARQVDGAIEFSGAPIPAAGLAYGASIALASIDGIDLAADDVQPFVIAAEPSLLASADCVSLVAQAALEPDAGSADGGGDAAAPDPELRARGLALIPKATLSGGYSYLMVAAGCLGAPSHTDALEDSVCGNGYAPESPTLAPVVVQMSRVTEPDRLGLQVVHASLAMDVVDVTSLPPQGRSLSPVLVAYGVVSGAIEPRPPNLSYPRSSYGVSVGEAELEVAFSAGSPTTLELPWSGILALGGVSKLEDGKTYALVLLGPSIHIGPDKWWNPPIVSLVPTSP